MRYLTISEIDDLARIVATKIGQIHYRSNNDLKLIYGIPRGGISAAYAVLTHFSPGLAKLTSHPEDATLFIDDLIDSGRTELKYLDTYKKPFYALLDKREEEWKDQWIVFPWEGSHESSIEDNVIRLLQYIGEDPQREGIRATPSRVARALREWYSGYDTKPEQILKTFTDGAEKVDEMIVVRDIPVYSHCEHHMAAIFGTATVAYIPNGKIVGLSKIPRLVEVFARRLQVQERLTNQIADALHEHLQPKGVGVVIKARHLCMESRGVNQQGHHTITSALRGVMRTVPEARAEFLNLAQQ